MTVANLIDIKAACDYLTLTETRLRGLLRDGKGPRHMRLGPQSPYRFRQTDLDAWIEAQFEASTSRPSSPAKKRTKKTIAQKGPLD